jgi:uncharacterized protein (DUF2235 family)
VSRRIVLCLDGTWNHTYMSKRRDDGSSVVKPTNVLKLARAVLPVDGSNRDQVVQYDIGVGSLAKYPGFFNRVLASTDKVLGGVRGAGFEDNLEAALGFLGLNHEPGDEVFVFGFSRGAATAQALTRFLDWSGGLPAKRDNYYLPQLFREYVVSHGRRASADVIEVINEKRAAETNSLGPLQPFRPVDVALLGVWDTVVALGGRKSFHVAPRPARCVRHVRQAIAVDEVRYDFRPEIWEGAQDGQTLQQRWFAGVHSNIGGGYVDDGLANLAFRWMVAEAEQLGLAVDRDFVGHYRGYAQDRLYRSESSFYNVADRLRRKRGRGRRALVDRPAQAALALDKSVLTRIQSRPDDPRFPDLRKSYRPGNVLRFFAAQADLDAYLRALKPNDPTLPDDARATVRKLGR